MSFYISFSELECLPEETNVGDATCVLISDDSGSFEQTKTACKDDHNMDMFVPLNDAQNNQLVMILLNKRKCLCMFIFIIFYFDATRNLNDHGKQYHW